MKVVPYHGVLVKEYVGEPWNFKEVWQVSGSAVIDESFHN